MQHVNDSTTGASSFVLSDPLRYRHASKWFMVPNEQTKTISRAPSFRSVDNDKNNPRTSFSRQLCSDNCRLLSVIPHNQYVLPHSPPPKMDLLRSLCVETVPEQQTRAAHLSDTLATDPDLRLGFNCCCVCGSRKMKASVECIHCRRVRYCSVECRQQDANPPNSTAYNNDDNEEEEEEGALGHSSVICSLLKLCNEDEKVEDNDAADPPRRTTAKTTTSKQESARDRIRSELESYPTTLGNVLLECPPFQPLWKKKTVIHVVGVSDDAELWGNGSFVKDQKKDGVASWWQAYAEALVSVAEEHRIQQVVVRFIGPECTEPSLSTVRRSVPLDSNPQQSYQLTLSIHQTFYDQKFLQSLQEQPTVVVLFNPGFTCPDYNWDMTVTCLMALKESTGFLVTTNTQMECVADCQYLLDKKLVATPPPILSHVLLDDPTQTNDDDNDEEEESEVIFAENPYAGDRVRQSGTMANDVFVKNRWMLCGLFNSSSKATTKKKKKKKRDRAQLLARGEEEEDDDVVDALARNQKKTKVPSNSKLTNPALV